MEKNNFKPSILCRFVSVVTAVFFLQAQFIVFAQIPQSEMVVISTPSAEKPAEETLSAADSASSINALDLTTDFLQNGLTLETVQPADEVNEKEELSAVIQTQPSVFEQALDFINKAKGFAAVIVDRITQSHLAELAKQVWEYGVAVVKGVIVLFTSHDENRLEVTAGFRKILDEESDFLLHKQSPGELDPSRTDYLGAAVRGKEEYLIALDGGVLGAARFNGSGQSEKL